MKHSPWVLIALFLLAQCKPEQYNKIDLSDQPQELQLFAPHIISTELYERDIAISPGGDEIIHTLSDYKQTRRCLVVNKKCGTRWQSKTILNFSGEYNDIEPFFSMDGNKLYFASDRPIRSDSNRRDYNIWVSDRQSQGWSDPSPLGPDINTVGDEFYPAVSKNYNLYFTSARESGTGKEDIYLSRFAYGVYQKPEPLDTNINSTTWEFNAYISPDEDLILFSSYGRKDDLGGGDLYFSKKDAQGNWMPSENLGPLINSDKLDYCPFADLQRGNFYFTSERFIIPDKKINNVAEIVQMANGLLNGMGNIYRISSDQMNFKP